MRPRLFPVSSLCSVSYTRRSHHKFNQSSHTPHTIAGRPLEVANAHSAPQRSLLPSLDQASAKHAQIRQWGPLPRPPAQLVVDRPVEQGQFQLLEELANHVQEGATPLLVSASASPVLAVRRLVRQGVCRVPHVQQALLQPSLARPFAAHARSALISLL